ncbi:RNA polymerase sigma factor [Dactylosporangium sucinum]|uniref:RNA polymerase sigma factor n=1 Tax=Dactylosporangium sucinum TaxID=1424081 RepID=A0A917UCP0_9ACTN|nr:sigma-70 family RNA polymerase sigma factor [Dactylosporangium sucinum]GGM69950.1 RNA polymerase sigma factor [Dactylosporangium sucinum]
MEDEATLVTRGASGDQAAFAELVTRHRSMIHAVCVRITGDPQAAADALQETLIRAWRGLPKFRGDARFSTWLYRIAVNAAVAEAQRGADRPQPVDPFDLTPPAGAGPAFADTIADRLAVQAALRRLPPQYRAAIVLRECADHSYEEIAEILQIPLNTVKSRISRARQALVSLLQPDGV